MKTRGGLLSFAINLLKMEGRHSLQARLENLRRRWPLLLCLGVVGSLAFAPFFIVPLLYLSLSGLLIIVGQSQRWISAFLAGWIWGFGHFLSSNYWIGSSFLVEADRFAWMIPFVLAGLASYLAIYPGLAMILVYFARKRSPLLQWIITGFAWMVCEWLRGHVLTGYPWNPVAYVWGFSAYFMQVAAYIGSWGLSFVTVLAGGSLFLLRWWRWPRVIGINLLIVTGIVLPGFLRITDLPETRFGIRIVQPGITQAERLDAAFERQHLRKLVDLSLQVPVSPDTKIVVWPEGATDSLLERHPEIRQEIGMAAPLGGYVLTGAIRITPTHGDVERVWNSMAALDAGGKIVAWFDKAHLVPLGEYVPGRKILPFINKLTPGYLDFSSGPGPRTIALQGVPPFGPMICYEAIFPAAVIDAENRPSWMLNITNDGWFGRTIGPYQHFTSARFRAVEEGLPLVRVANTGISAVIDPYGQIVHILELGEQGLLDAYLPAPLPVTPYKRLLSVILSFW